MSKRQREVLGFTLIEVLLAVAITAMIVTVVATSFVSTLQSRREVATLTESTEAGSRILNLIQRDLEGLWHHNIKNNRVLVGRNLDIAGPPADRIDFLTTTDSVGIIRDTQDLPKRASICEVGYCLKSNPQDPLLMELWRREDPMVDDDLLTGGSYQLVHDRIRSFDIVYYKTLGKTAEEFLEWDSSAEDSLPRRLKIEFTIERKLPSGNRVSHAEVEDFEDLTKKYVRHIVLDRRYPKILEQGTALVPVLPPPPEMVAEAGAGPDGGGGPAGGGGGAGAKGGPGREGDGKQREITTGEGRRGEGGRGGDGSGGRGTGQIPGGQRPSLPPGFFPGSGSAGGINLGELLKNLGGGGGR